MTTLIETDAELGIVLMGLFECDFVPRCAFALGVFLRLIHLSLRVLILHGLFGRRDIGLALFGLLLWYLWLCHIKRSILMHASSLRIGLLFASIQIFKKLAFNHLQVGNV